MARALCDGQGHNEQEIIIERPDGSRRIVLAHANPFFDDSGRLAGAVNVLVDVTDQRRTQKALAAEQRVLRSITTGAPLPQVLDELMRETEAQSADGMLCSVLLVDDTGTKLVHGAAPSLPEAYNQAVHGIPIGPCFGSCGTAASRRRPVFVTDIAADPLWADFKELAAAHGLGACCSTPIFSSQGDLLGTAAMYYRRPHNPSSHDQELIARAAQLAGIVIERKWADEANAKLAAVVESSDDAIITKDLNGVITSWNQGAQRIFGYTALEAIGQPVTMLMPSDRVNEEPGILERIRRGERIEHYETVRRRKDGTLLDISLTVSPIIDVHGRIVGASKIARDITDRKRAEAERRAADRRKDEFLATLAHELRNPLAPLRNGLQVMKLARNDAAAVEQVRAMMERQLGQMVRLIDDLLDISRISQGKVTLRKARVELAQILQQAVETSRPLIDASGHDLTIDVPSVPIVVNADPMRLAQVFANLLNNSAKYTEPGGRIALTVERHGSEAAVSVRDNGIGIPAEMLPKVFELFMQVDRGLEKAQGGLGIGLSLVKGLVEMHGGRIEAKSDGPGRGSEFTVHLPLPKEVGGRRKDKSDASPAAVAASFKVLIADDNRDGAESLAMVLRIIGNEVRVAHDGQQALDAAARFRPDVILLDIGMPRLNGYETCRRIREQPWGKAAMLVALTGWGQDDDRRRSHEAGFDLHLVKPVEPAALDELLASLASAAGSRAQVGVDGLQ